MCADVCVCVYDYGCLERFYYVLVPYMFPPLCFVTKLRFMPGAVKLSHDMGQVLMLSLV